MEHTELERGTASVRPGPPTGPADSGAIRVQQIIATPSKRAPRPAPEKKPRRGLSILQKLLILILSLVLGVVAMLGVYLLTGQVADMRAGLELKAAAYGRLVSKQVESAIAFDDRETAREVFDSVAQDADVESLTLFTAKGNVLRAWGSMSSDLSQEINGVTAQKMLVRKEQIVVLAPVVSLEGPRGTLVVELSTRRLTESLARARQRAALAFVLAALLGAVGAFSIARSLSRRLQAIANAADAAAAGDLNQKPVDDGQRGDEIGVMVTAFNAMLRQIRELVEHIRKVAREEQARLTQLVAERTAELDARNGDMRRVLDNVGQGFLTINTKGEMSRERSRILETWFGKAPESGSFIEYLGRLDPTAAAWFSLGWDAVVEGTLPLEVTLDQLPKRLFLAGRHFQVEYRPILDANGALERALLVLSDVTAALERERAEADEREVTRLFTRIVADRAGFLEFFSEARALVDAVSSGALDGERLKRSLHTLKGNAAIYGIDSVARLCHDLEDTLAETATLSEQAASPLCARWNELASKVRVLLGESRDRLEISEDDYQQISKAVGAHAPHAEIQNMIQSWRLEPTESRLRRVAEHAEAFAARLEKAPPSVDIEHNQLRLRAEDWSEFWSASIHVVRNSIDHGLETPEERTQAGKSPEGHLGFRTRLTATHFSVEFSDDGRGIDWARVSEKAKASGLAVATRKDLIEALFADGLSTRDAVTQNSGRGVGLAAVRTACQKLGGAVEVESEAGKGSLFRFVWPAAVLGAQLRSSRSPQSLAR